MMTIEHFLLDIIQIFVRDWIENTIADIGRCEAVIDFFQPTLRNFFYKRWPIIFLYGTGFFLLGVAEKIYKVGRLGFFVRAQPKLCFCRHRHLFHLHAEECISQRRQKNMIHRYWSKKIASRRRPGKMTDRFINKKDHRMMPIEHFLIDIIQIFVRDWIENTIADIGRCEAAIDIFQPTLRNFFYKRWPIIFFYGTVFFFWVLPKKFTL